MSAKKAKNENKIGLVFKIFDKDYSKNDMVKNNINGNNHRKTMEKINQKNCSKNNRNN